MIDNLRREEPEKRRDETFIDPGMTGIGGQVVRFVAVGRIPQSDGSLVEKTFNGDVRVEDGSVAPLLLLVGELMRTLTGAHPEALGICELQVNAKFIDVKEGQS